MGCAGDVEQFGLGGTGADEYGVEALGEQIVHGVVLADGGVEVEDHAEVLYLLYLAAHHLLG